MMQFLKPGFVQIAFGGGDSGGGGGGGNGGSAGGVIGFLGNLITAAATPTVSRADRPVQRPSVISRGDQMVATRDMPRFGISAGDTAATPDYSGFSLRGLTSTDTGNVMRNIQGAEREARAEAARRAGSNGSDDAPSPTQMAAPAAPAQATAPVAATRPTPAPPTPSSAPAGQAATAEELASSPAVAEAEATAKRGRRSTIATDSQGILGTSNTRARRSLVSGGGLIR